MTGYANYPSIEDRTVFITRGASGIGESLVEAFVRQKSRIAFIDIDVTAGRLLQKHLQEKELRCPWFRECDVREISELESCFKSRRPPI